MADNVALSLGSEDGAVIATDDATGVHHQYVKLEFGADNTQTKVQAAAPLPVQIGDGTDAALVSAGGALLVDGSATTQPISHAALTELAAAIDTEVQVDIVSSALPTGAATSAKQDTVIGHLDGVEGLLTTIDGDTGAVKTATEAIQAAVEGTLDVAGPLTDAELRAVAVPVSGTVAVTNAGLTELAAAINASSQMDVNLAANGIGLATSAKQDTEIASLSVMDDWDNAASDGASVSGDVAHDSADAGEPVKVGFKAYSPDGTAPGTAVAEADRTNAKADLDGRQYVTTMHPENWSYHDDDAAAVTTDGTLHADPGDGFAVFITDIVFSIGAATASSLFIEEGSTKILGPYYLEAIAGRGLALHFETPKRCTASTAILITNTGSILFSIDVLGFVAAV